MSLSSLMCAPEADKSSISLFVVIIGSIFSIISVISNSLIFYCIFKSPRRCKCYFQFLMILSLLDIIVSACYTPVILVDSLKDWLNSYFLAQIWRRYFVYMLAVTHVAMTTSSFVLVGALFERYLITIRSYCLKYYQSKRTFLCVVSLFISMFAKGGIMFELDVFRSDDPLCEGTINEYFVFTTVLTEGYVYGTIYRFWVRHFVTVFVPFFLLTLINAGTLYELKNQMTGVRALLTTRFALRVENKSKVRSATLTLLLVCGLYLLSNVLNLVVTAWEFVNMKSLTEEFYDFYMFSTDLISLFVVIACALRLPIYMLSNPELRRLFRRQLKKSYSTRDIKSILL